MAATESDTAFDASVATTEEIGAEILRLTLPPRQQAIDQDPRLLAADLEIERAVRFVDHAWNPRTHPQQIIAATMRDKAQQNLLVGLQNQYSALVGAGGFLGRTCAFFRRIEYVGLRGVVKGRLATAIMEAEAQVKTGRAASHTAGTELAALRLRENLAEADRANIAHLRQERTVLRHHIESDYDRLVEPNSRRIASLRLELGYREKSVARWLTEFGIIARNRGDQVLGFRDEDIPWTTAVGDIKRLFGRYLGLSSQGRQSLLASARRALQRDRDHPKSPNTVSVSLGQLSALRSRAEVFGHGRQMVDLLRRLARERASGTKGFRDGDLAWKGVSAHTRGLVAEFVRRSTDEQAEFVAELEKVLQAQFEQRGNLIQIIGREKKLWEELSRCLASANSQPQVRPSPTRAKQWSLL